MLYYQYIDIPNSNSNIILLLLILIAIKLANITIDSFADYSNRTRMGYDMDPIAYHLYYYQILLFIYH